MIPTPPPPRRRYRPMYLEFAPIPAGLVRRIRIVSRAIGYLSIGVALATGIAIVSFGFLLPTGLSARMIFTVFMGGLSSFFALFSGITLVTSPSYVKTGELNVTHARQSRRLLLIFWIATIVPTCISVLFFTSAADTDASFTPSVLGYWALLWVPFAFSLTDMIIGRRLLQLPNRAANRIDR